MLKHGRAGVPMEVMGLMLGEFVDDYTVRVIDVFAMPQSGTVSILTLSFMNIHKLHPPWVIDYTVRVIDVFAIFATVGNCKYLNTFLHEYSC